MTTKKKVEGYYEGAVGYYEDTVKKLEEWKEDRLFAKEVNVGNYTIGEEGEVIEYLRCLVKVYSIEDKRKKLFQNMMNELFRYEMHLFSITDGYTTDGIILYTIKGNQCLEISGDVFREDIIIESLTSLILLVSILCYHDYIINILVILNALKAELTELKAYYNDVKLDKLDIELQSYFPYPHSF
ncbi:8961_t:CDS:2 [Funneliformis caledonium]|uniref:8961_t:CDS:1 n=1 Tax=Funneliformis caledonium TaxID=1117310 RepID=A0A9N9DND3_9GLOM|nr:8961_t:CDS:2 [Funneliformis caledonium]